MLEGSSKINYITSFLSIVKWKHHERMMQILGMLSHVIWPDDCTSEAGTMPMYYLFVI